MTCLTTDAPRLRYAKARKPTYTKVAPAFSYFGGKTLLAGRLAEHLPSHHIYVEVFGGGGSMLLAKAPSPVEVYNDIDRGLVDFFACMRDEHRAARLQYLCSRTPYARAVWEEYRDTWHTAEDVVDRAYKWFYVMRGSFSGIFGRSFSNAVTHTSHGAAGTSSRWFGAVEQIAAVSERLRRVQVERLDFRKAIDTYDTPNTLFYLDPPYVHATRRGGQYGHELCDADHEALVRRLLDVRGMAMLSGYDHALYRPLEEAGWRTVRWQQSCSAAARTRRTGLLGDGAAQEQQRTECLWMSPGVKLSRAAIERITHAGGDR